MRLLEARKTVVTERPSVDPAAVSVDGPPNLAEAGPLCAGECVERIDDLRAGGELGVSWHPDEKVRGSRAVALDELGFDSLELVGGECREQPHARWSVSMDISPHGRAGSRARR